MSRAVHEFVQQGIPARWVEQSGPFQAHLTFGVGGRDEAPVRLGMTHLAEHAVMRTLGTALGAGAQAHASHYALVFSCAGEPEQVLDFLRRLSRFLDDPAVTQETVDHEKRIIEAETPGDLQPQRGPLTYRYGLVGVGVCDAGIASMAAIAADDVNAWLRRWCVRENAQLVLSGPPPAELDVALRSSENGLPARRAAISSMARPTILDTGTTGVTLALEAPSTRSIVLGAAIEHVLMNVLRIDRALIYSVNVSITSISPDVDHVTISLDPLPEDVTETTSAAVHRLRQVAREGFSDEVMAYVRDSARLGLGDENDELERQVVRSLELLAGLPAPTAAEMLENALGVTAQQLTEDLRAALETLLVIVDSDECEYSALADDLGLHRDENRWGESTSRRGHGGRRRRGTGLFFRHWVRFDSAHLVVHEFGETRRVRWEDIAVVGRFGDGSLALIGVDGSSDVMPVELWRPAILDEVMSYLPDDVVCDFSWIDARPDRPGPASSLDR